MSLHEQESLRRNPCGCIECGGCAAQSCAAEGGAAEARGPALWRVACAEAAGTALLVALTCLSGCTAPAAPPASALQRALAGGLIVTLIVQCFDHVSGALVNPTVTLAAVVRGRVTRSAGVVLAAAQVAGAVAAPALLRLLAPPPAGASACLTLPAEHISVYKAVGIEALLSGCLALANCASWDARNRLLVGSWPARVGLIVAGLTLAAGDLTGASMNPARSFGPALWAGHFDRHWVYWAGPLGGSLVCSALYACAWRAPPGAAARAHPSPRAHPPPRAHQPPQAIPTHHKSLVSSQTS